MPALPSQWIRAPRGLLAHGLGLLMLLAGPGAAQEAIPVAEYAARRDALGDLVGNGVVIAFGGATPTTDYGPFTQLPAFRYLTGYDLADAALIIVVRDRRPASTLFVKRTAPRRSLYYGAEPDSAEVAATLDLTSRPIEDVRQVADSLADLGLPVYAVRDFRAADFATEDSLTRGG